MTRSWPYPAVAAHRGGGSLAPENTLAAIDVGIRHGHKMIEFDAKLSQDGQIFLLHDDTLDRTSDSWGIAGNLPWQQLLQVDVGNWYSPTFGGERLPLLSDVAARCAEHGIAANIEIKPTTGTDAHTGHVVALAARELWRGHAMPPLLSSFSNEALAAAQQAAPELPRGLLRDTWDENWLQQVRELDCVSIHFNHNALTPQRVNDIKAAGLRILVYTVNSPERARTLLQWGVDCICTDRIDLIGADFS